MKTQRGYLRVGVAGLIGFAVLVFPFDGLAEVVFDGSIGGYKGNATGSPIQIPYEKGKTGEIAGQNLFHSFSKFNLATGETATFTGPSNIQNILARVTDGPSSINGTIQSNIQGANLFLMNPAGIVFGSGARVNVTGAFHATTADYIELSDGRVFLADASGSTNLLSAPPEAFGFLSESSRAGIIRVEGVGTTLVSGMNLAGRDIGLVGRKVELSNTYLKSAGGKVSLAATGGGEARVALGIPPRGAPPDPSISGEVTLSNSAISVSGADNGQILIRGGKVSINGAASGFIFSGSQVDSFTGIDADAKGTGSAGAIRIESAGDILLGNNARIASFSRNNKTGGEVNLHAGGGVFLTGGATVVASANSTGGAGLIRIAASGLRIDGTDSSGPTRLSAQSNSSATGAGGTIDVDLSGALVLLSGGTIESNSLSIGNAGSISVRASGLHISGGQSSRLTGISSSNLSSGAGGSIHVEISGHARIEDRGLLAAFNSGSATAPSLIDFRSSSLDIIGLESSKELGNDFLTGIVGQVTPGASGRAADIRVAVGSTIQLKRGGLIDASVLSSASSTAAGRGGNIEVSSGALLIDRMGSEFFTGIGSDTEYTGGAVGQVPTWNAGYISVTSGAITLLNGGLISSSTAGTGNAGNVTVAAGSINATGQGTDSKYVFATGSGIVAATKMNSFGNGGDVTITASGALTVQQGGLLGAQSLGDGTGGSVTIQAGSTRLYDGGSISSNTAGVGRAGGITLTTGDLIVQDSEIGVRAAQADAGKLEVLSSDDIRITGGLITADAGGFGNAGNVSVHGRDILITGRGNGKTAGIVASTGVNSSGQGGNVDVLASGDLTLQQGGRIAAESLGLGTGGSLQIQAANLLVNDSEIGVLAKNANAGTLVVDVSGDITMRGGLVTASAGRNGGDIVIRGGGIIYIAQSLVTADAQGNGGNITFDRARHLVLNGTTVSASAVDENGGNIFISTGTFFANESILSVTSARGAPGTVSIETIDSLSGGEETQEVELLNPDDVLQPDCTKRAASTTSSFTQAGRGGTRRLPGGYLPSFRIFQ